MEMSDAYVSIRRLAFGVLGQGFFSVLEPLFGLGICACWSGSGRWKLEAAVAAGLGADSRQA